MTKHVYTIGKSTYDVLTAEAGCENKLSDKFSYIDKSEVEQLRKIMPGFRCVPDDLCVPIPIMEWAVKCRISDLETQNAIIDERCKAIYQHLRDRQDIWKKNKSTFSDFNNLFDNGTRSRLVQISIEHIADSNFVEALEELYLSVPKRISDQRHLQFPQFNALPRYFNIAFATIRSSFTNQQVTKYIHILICASHRLGSQRFDFKNTEHDLRQFLQLKSSLPKAVATAPMQQSVDTQLSTASTTLTAVVSNQSQQTAQSSCKYAVKKSTATSLAPLWPIQPATVSPPAPTTDTSNPPGDKQPTVTSRTTRASVRATTEVKLFAININNSSNSYNNNNTNNNNYFDESGDDNGSIYSPSEDNRDDDDTNVHNNNTNAIVTTNKNKNSSSRKSAKSAKNNKQNCANQIIDDSDNDDTLMQRWNKVLNKPPVYNHVSNKDVNDTFTDAMCVALFHMLELNKSISSMVEPILNHKVWAPLWKLLKPGHLRNKLFRNFTEPDWQDVTAYRPKWIANKIKYLLTKHSWRIELGPFLEAVFVKHFREYGSDIISSVYANYNCTNNNSCDNNNTYNNSFNDGMNATSGSNSSSYTHHDLRNNDANSCSNKNISNNCVSNSNSNNSNNVPLKVHDSKVFIPITLPQDKSIISMLLDKHNCRIGMRELRLFTKMNKLRDSSVRCIINNHTENIKRRNTKSNSKSAINKRSIHELYLNDVPDADYTAGVMSNIISNSSDNTGSSNSNSSNNSVCNSVNNSTTANNHSVDNNNSTTTNVSYSLNNIIPKYRPVKCGKYTPKRLND